MKNILLFISLIILTNIALAKGPEKVASYDRSSYPYLLKTEKDFDKASTLEILVFMKALSEVKLEENFLKKYLILKKIDINSINKFHNKIEDLMLKNYRISVKKLPEFDVKNTEELYKRANKPVVNKALLDWHNKSLRFHRRYVYEQFRLAALFPRITSEILLFSENEIRGDKYKDKHFLLTFDDGPANKSKGNTEKTIAVLKKYNIDGLFFVLGKTLSRRYTKEPDYIRTLYKGMYTASHGMEHYSHAKKKSWKKSIIETKNLLDKVFSHNLKSNSYFRPPYGQRKNAAFFKDNKISVMLWNIDSQDWSRKLNPEMIRDRIITLMLLWRKGVILFHDVHPKAYIALPEIIEQTKSAGIKWIKCKDL